MRGIFMMKKHMLITLSLMMIIGLNGSTAQGRCTSCNGQKKSKNPVTVIATATGNACKGCVKGVRTLGRKVIKEPAQKVFSKKSKRKTSTSASTHDANEITLKEISSQEEFEQMIQSGQPLLVDVYISACGACQVMKPRIKKAAKKYPQVVVATINAEKLDSIRTEYAIKGFPTLLFFKDGKKVQQIMGTLEMNSLEKEIEKLL